MMKRKLFRCSADGEDKEYMNRALYLRSDTIIHKRLVALININSLLYKNTVNYVSQPTLLDMNAKECIAVLVRLYQESMTQE